jgi:hypothetical protein
MRPVTVSRDNVAAFVLVLALAIGSAIGRESAIAAALIYITAATVVAFLLLAIVLRALRRAAAVARYRA